MTALITGDDGLARPAWAAADPLLREYYDTEWGMPVTDEAGLFERIALEGFQSGLSWRTILAKRPAFRAAFARFTPDVVARFGDDDVERLAADASIIRNRSKIRAAIDGARATVALRERGGLPALIWAHRPARTPIPGPDEPLPTRSPESEALAAELKRAGFRYVGPVTAFALMSAIGMVDLHPVGAHRRGCSGLWADDGTAVADPPGLPAHPLGGENPTG